MGVSGLYSFTLLFEWHLDWQLLGQASFYHALASRLDGHGKAVVCLQGSLNVDGPEMHRLLHFIQIYYIITCKFETCIEKRFLADAAHASRGLTK
jgi:hypothetical protein